MSGNRPVDRRFRNANPEAEADAVLRLALGGRRLGAATVSVAATRSDVQIAHIPGVDAGAEAVMERDFRNVTRRNSPACRSATPARPLGAPDQPFGWLQVAEPSGRWIPLSMHPSEGNPPPASENLSLCCDSVAIVAGARSHPIRGVLPRIHEAPDHLRACLWRPRHLASERVGGSCGVDRAQVIAVRVFGKSAFAQHDDPTPCRGVPSVYDVARARPIDQQSSHRAPL